ARQVRLERWVTLPAVTPLTGDWEHLQSGSHLELCPSGAAHPEPIPAERRTHRTAYPATIPAARRAHRCPRRHRGHIECSLRAPHAESGTGSRGATVSASGPAALSSPGPAACSEATARSILAMTKRGSRRGEKPRTRAPQRLSHSPTKMSGGDLLSHTLPSAVPSAQSSLATGFGMEPGVSSTL